MKLPEERIRVRYARCPVFFPAVIVLAVIVLLLYFRAVPAHGSESGFQDSSQVDTAAVDSASSAGSDNSRKNVFVLASYELDWYSEKVMLDGVMNELGQDIMLRYYFMDTKNQELSFAVSQLKTFLDKGRTEEEDYDAVIALDDNAFDFVLQYKEQYFKGLPVVFCGVNSEEKGRRAAKDTSITGVVEAFPVRKTIEVASSLQPKATRVLVIVDDSVEAEGTKEQYQAVEKNFPDLDFYYVNPVPMTDSQMQNFLSGLKEDTILVLGLMGHGPGRKTYTASMAARYISGCAKIPLYKADEDGMGYGLLGGCVISYNEMGERAGRMVHSILEGKKVGDIPVETASARYLFDAEQMERFHIEKRQLPSGSVYVNGRENFVRRHWLQILMAGAFGTLAMMVIIVVVTRRSRNEVRVALERERQAEKARNDFFARMSHEMRTPLNAIIGYAELGAEDEAESGRGGYYQKIDSSGKYLLSVINDVLDLGKLESGALKLHPEEVVLSEVMTGVRTIIVPLCQKNHLSYLPERHFQEDRVIMADPVRLQQIMINLLGNSAKYTEPGGWVRFTCFEIKTDDAASMQYEFRIEDNGIGMSEEYQKHLFTEFTRENRKETFRKQGSGLGLIITKQLVDLMGGSIDVKSVLGKGTRFTVRLSFPVVSQIRARQSIERKEAEKAQRSVSLKGMHVLLAEDNELNAEIEKMMLEREGLVVDRVENGLVACERFAGSDEGTYQAILMDLMMPVCDGFEAAKKIRQMNRADAETIPILALSASVQESDHVKALMSGMTGVLTKPIEREALLKSLEKVL